MLGYKSTMVVQVIQESLSLTYFHFLSCHVFGKGRGINRHIAMKFKFKKSMSIYLEKR